MFKGSDNMKNVAVMLLKQKFEIHVYIHMAYKML